MVDPVLNRPMFQGSSPMVQGSALPLNNAKGTGITSMVTPPDQGAQQLKAFANPVNPTVQGFADGGPVSSMWDNFVNSLTIKGETTNPFQGPTPMKSGNYRLPDVGLRIGQPSTDYRKDTAITGTAPNYVEPIDIGSPKATYDPSLRDILGETPITRPGIEEMARVNPVTTQGERELPREESQPRVDDREAARAAGLASLVREPPPPMPKEGFQVETSVNPEKPKGEIATNLADIRAQREAQSSADRRENALLALMSAGFGMAAGKSRHALSNIAEGGQQGIGTFAQLEKSRREDENRRYLAALHEKEVALRERELKAREPLIAAQTKAQEQLPEYRQKMNEVRADVARSHAQQMADKAFKDIMSNPMSPEFKAIAADKTGTVAPAIKKKLEETYFGAKYKELMLQQNDGLGIRSVNQPSE